MDIGKFTEQSHKHLDKNNWMSDYCTMQVCSARTGDPPSGFAAEANVLSNYCLWGHCNLQIFQPIQGSVPRNETGCRKRHNSEMKQCW